MSLLARAEDFERLAIRWASVPHEGATPAEVIAAVAAFPERFAADRDSLPQNDADRAFALVDKASRILDDTVFEAESDERADQLTLTAAGYLDEALRLDPHCWDALRIRHSLDNGGRDAMVGFLEERREEVRDACLETSRAAGIVPAEHHWSSSVYLRPYLRWELNLANEQLNCGRYHASRAVCERIFDFDAKDVFGARHVAAYDCVKLEDEAGFAELCARFPDDANGAWFMLARCFLAYRARRMDEATEVLHQIVRTFPDAGGILSYQEELTAGTFGHLDYAPGTSDELFVAVSEAAVILDENCGDALSPVSDWVARDALVTQARESEEAARDLKAKQGGASEAGAQEGGR